MGKKISFVSSKNRGITLDMLVVKDFFRVNDEKVEFKDVVANENAKNSLVKKGNISIRKEYCKNNTDIICVDGSIAGKLPKNAPEGKRAVSYTHLVPFISTERWKTNHRLLIRRGEKKKDILLFWKTDISGL